MNDFMVVSPLTNTTNTFRKDANIKEKRGIRDSHEGTLIY